MKTLPAGHRAAPAHRRARAVESFQTAGECIGPITPGYSVFAITRGQFSMVDAALWCIDQLTRPPDAQPCTAAVSIWTWTIADYEIECFERLRNAGNLHAGKLIIDGSARNKNSALIAKWKTNFGAGSVRYVVNHSKIVTIQTERMKLLIRGSMNLNFNPRFEQLDITADGEDFNLVNRIEEELPILEDACTGQEIFKASRVADAFEPEKLAFFQNLNTMSKLKVWQK